MISLEERLIRKGSLTLLDKLVTVSDDKKDCSDYCQNIVWLLWQLSEYDENEPKSVTRFFYSVTRMETSAPEYKHILRRISKEVSIPENSVYRLCSSRAGLVPKVILCSLFTSMIEEYRQYQDEKPFNEVDIPLVIYRLMHQIHELTTESTASKFWQSVIADYDGEYKYRLGLILGEGYYKDSD